MQWNPPLVGWHHIDVVDLITWDKRRMGMGYRTRRCCEYALISQKHPEQSKGVWRRHDIPDVWTESAVRLAGVHPNRMLK